MPMQWLPFFRARLDRAYRKQAFTRSFIAVGTARLTRRSLSAATYSQPAKAAVRTYNIDFSGAYLTSSAEDFVRTHRLWLADYFCRYNLPSNFYASPAARKFASRISEYLRDRTTP